MSKLDTMEELLGEVRAMNETVHRVDRLYGHTLLSKPWRLLLLQFAVGLVRGVGSFLGATIVVAVLIYILSCFTLTERLLEYFHIAL